MTPLSGRNAPSRAPVTAETVKLRFFHEAFDRPLLDNTMRGLWCEFMVAEALGADCRAVGFGWHPWDLQIGPATSALPDRIRIQLKNSALLQSWNAASGRLSKPLFNLTWRHRPSYFVRDFPSIPCEDEGFLCDLFILCFHGEARIDVADHRDPDQWQFYLLPVTGSSCAITQSELAALQSRVRATGKPATVQRQPTTLETGIRGRPPAAPVKITELTIGALQALFQS